MIKSVNVGYGDVAKVKVGADERLAFIGGPCAIESLDHSLKMAERTQAICEKLDISFIFKSCYDKDCRSSPESFHGVGIDSGLRILSEVRSTFNVPVVSDFSVPEWAEQTGEVCDLVQVPAYLCRQTSILKAAAKTGRPVLLKKGQYMSPWNMKNSVKKLDYFGCKEVILAERGSFFGYNSLVNDFTSFPIMAEAGFPVCYDATHSIQMPTSMGSVSGGQRQYIPHLVRSAVSNGIQALFMEVHDNPAKALSDPNTVLDIEYLHDILYQASELHKKVAELKFKLGEINNVAR